VVICENNLEQKEMVRDTMLHEGVHAFDDCRANVDWSNCVHHACSEVRVRLRATAAVFAFRACLTPFAASSQIRAANLSGDCSFRAEVARGHFNIRAQQMVQLTHHTASCSRFTCWQVDDPAFWVGVCRSA
jgi:inner membrane protease ATP23